MGHPCPFQLRCLGLSSVDSVTEMVTFGCCPQCKRDNKKHQVSLFFYDVFLFI